MLFRRRQAPTILEGEFDCEVVGESNYQDAFIAICGPKCEEGFYMDCLAILRPEPTNPYDRAAVAVFVEGRKVGYLRREVAAELQPVVARYEQRRGPCTVRGRVVGGWRRGSDDEGHFGIWLRLPAPDRIA